MNGRPWEPSDARARWEWYAKRLKRTTALARRAHKLMLDDVPPSEDMRADCAALARKLKGYADAIVIELGGEPES
jgi:hypothetical protein